ncbi:hypothetical protein IAT38_002959 [Cryptococcus sp. DSM 104549]
MAATTAPANPSIWTAPKWVQSFYARFPLATLPQEDELDWEKQAESLGPQACVLWIHPPTQASHPHHRSWLSPLPSSLRTQLLFLLRNTPSQPNITFRPWANEAAAPGGELPVLHLPGQGRVLSTGEVRGWLEGTFPLRGKGKEWQGLPSQEAYDKGLALAQLILGHLLPAYLASLPPSASSPTHSAFSANPLHLLFPTPPPLAAGLTTPLPASLTGDARSLDREEVIRKGVEAVRALVGVKGVKGDGDWALGASHPTSLDALIASHLYALYALPAGSALRLAVEESGEVGEYVERVLNFAEARRGKV